MQRIPELTHVIELKLELGPEWTVCLKPGTSCAHSFSPLWISFLFDVSSLVIHSYLSLNLLVSVLPLSRDLELTPVNHEL